MQTHTDFAANLAFFLQDKTGSIFGHWSGRMSAKDQRALMIEPHVSGGRVCTRCCGV